MNKMLLLGITFIVFVAIASQADAQLASKYDYLKKIDTRPDLAWAYTEYELCNPTDFKYLDGIVLDWASGNEYVKGTRYKIKRNVTIPYEYPIMATREVCRNPLINETPGQKCHDEPYTKSYETRYRYKTEWVDWDGTVSQRLSALAPKCERIRVYGDLRPVLGSRSIDHVPNIKILSNWISYPEYDEWNASWLYRKSLEINASEPFVNIQVKIIIDDADINANAKADFSDLRFFTNCTNDAVELYAWNESHITSTEVVVWLNISTTPLNNSFCVYYGNPLASEVWDGNKTFTFWEDFENYATGSQLVGQGGWTGVSGGHEITEYMPYEGVKSVLGTGAGVDYSAIHTIPSGMESVLFGSMTLANATNNYHQFRFMNSTNLISGISFRPSRTGQYIGTGLWNSFSPAVNWADNIYYKWNMTWINLTTGNYCWNSTCNINTMYNTPSSGMPDTLRLFVPSDGTNDFSQTDAIFIANTTYPGVSYGFGAQQVAPVQPQLGVFIAAPVNQTYFTSTINLDWYANKTIEWAAFSVNGGANNTSIYPGYIYSGMSYDINVTEQADDEYTPRGIDINDTNFWVAFYDSGGAPFESKVRQYTLDGTNISEFKTGDNIAGITTNDTDLFITLGGGSPLLRHAYLNGTIINQTSLGFTNPVGITHDNDLLYLTFVSPDWVYVFDTDLAIQPLNWSLNATNANPRDITNDGSYLYVSDTNGGVYQYGFDGTFYGMLFNTSLNYLWGLAMNTTHFLAGDYVDDKIYLYNNNLLFNTTITPTVGINNVTVWANDSSGNTSSATVWFTYALPTDVNMTLVATPAWTSTQSTITISCLSNATGTLTLKKDGGIVANPYAAALDNGVYNFSCGLVPLNASETFYINNFTSNNLNVNVGVFDCVNTTTFAFTKNVSGLVGDTYTLDLTGLVGANFIRNNLTDVWLSVGGWKNTTGGYYITANITGVSDFTVKFGNYIANEQYNYAPLSENSTILSGYTQDNGYYTITFRDEVTNDVTLPPNANTTLTMYCSLGSTFFTVNDSAILIPTLDTKADSFKAVVAYGSDFYIRSLLVDLATESKVFYLVDAFTFTVVQIPTYITDYAWYGAEIMFYKLSGGTPIIITEGYFDLDHKFVAYLMKDEPYNIRLTMGSSIREIGFYQPAQAETLNLEISPIGINPDLSYLAGNLLMGAENISMTTLRVTYQDLTNRTTNVRIRIYENVNRTALFDGNYSGVSSINITIGGLNMTNYYTVMFDITHQDYGNSPVQFSLLVGNILSDLGFGTIATWIYAAAGFIVMLFASFAITPKNRFAGLVFLLTAFIVLLLLTWFTFAPEILALIIVFIAVAIIYEFKKGGML